MKSLKRQERGQQMNKDVSQPVLPMLPDTPNTRRLARAMLVATIRYNLLARPSEKRTQSA